MDIPKRSEERPQSLLGDQRRKTAYKYSSIIRIRRSQLLPVRSNEVSKNRTSLGMMFPRLLRDHIPRRRTILLRHPRLVDLHLRIDERMRVGVGLHLDGTDCPIRVLLGDLHENVIRQIHHIVSAKSGRRDTRAGTCPG